MRPQPDPRQSETHPDAGTIYAALRQRVALLDYPPGAMLSENRLAREFGVSRTPVRRALHRLEFDGLVSVERGVGTIVTAIDMIYLKQVYALRLKLIDLIGELEPGWIDEAEVRHLGALRAQAERAGRAHEPRALARVYLDFNETVTRAIGNEPLRDIADRLFYQTSRVWLQALPGLSWDDEVAIMREEMDVTARALQDGDMQAVARVRRRHLIDCIHRVNAYLGSFELVPDA